MASMKLEKHRTSQPGDLAGKSGVGRRRSRDSDYSLVDLGPDKPQTPMLEIPMRIGLDAGYSRSECEHGSFAVASR